MTNFYLTLPFFLNTIRHMDFSFELTFLFHGQKKLYNKPVKMFLFRPYEPVFDNG